MRNLPESRHAPVTPCFRNFDRLNAVQPRQGRVRATRRSSVSAPGNGIKRSTTIRTLPPIAKTDPPHTGATCGDTRGVGHVPTRSGIPAASVWVCAAGEAEGCSGGDEGSGSGEAGGSSGTTGGGGGSPGPGALGSGVGRGPPREGSGVPGPAGTGTALPGSADGPRPEAFASGLRDAPRSDCASARPPPEPDLPVPDTVSPSGRADAPLRSAEREGAGFPASSPTLTQPVDAATVSAVTAAQRTRADNWRTGGPPGRRGRAGTRERCVQLPCPHRGHARTRPGIPDRPPRPPSRTAQKPPASSAPRKTAPSPTSRDASTFAPARKPRPSSASRSVSYENVEYVVSAPHRPVPSNAWTGADTVAPVSTPSSRLPAAFTVNVPHGKTYGSPAPCRACTARSVRYRSGAPTAPPRTTSSQFTTPSAVRPR